MAHVLWQFQEPRVRSREIQGRGGKIALKLVKEEYERLGEIERAVLRGLSLLNSPSWRNLKKVTEALLGREVKDWSFTHALKQLINARVAKKEGENYSLVDPMYRELLKTGD